MIWRISIILLLLACKNKATEEDFAAATAEGSLSYAQVYNYLLSNNGLIRSSAKKAASKLKFSFIHAGIQTDEYGQYIKLFFHADDDRDYIEVARCGVSKKSNTCLFGKGLGDGNTMSIEEINKVISSDNDFSHLTSAHLNNCWNDLTKGCTIIGEASTDSEDNITAVHKITAGDTFIDLTASKDEEVYYIARVCIDDDRLDERESSNQPCSHIFRYTNDVTLKFDNKRTKEKRALIKELGKLSEELNYMTKRGHELSLEIVDGLDTCGKRKREHERAKNVRDSIATLTGIGIGMAASIYVFGAKDIKNMGVGADAGKALGAAFADIMRSVNDYPRSTCPEADSAIAEITKLMGYTNAANLEEVTDRESNGYLYDVKVAKYEEKLMKYQALDDNYVEWFTKACFVAEVKQSQEASDICGD